eukprot:225680-Pyramimonas_sp.AAC.1
MSVSSPTLHPSTPHHRAGGAIARAPRSSDPHRRKSHGRKTAVYSTVLYSTVLNSTHRRNSVPPDGVVVRAGPRVT